MVMTTEILGRISQAIQIISVHSYLFYVCITLILFPMNMVEIHSKILCVCVCVSVCACARVCS